MAEGVARFKIDLCLAGDQLNGEIQFAQDSLKLTPRLAKSPSEQLSVVLKDALADVKRLEAKVALAGTLKRPKIRIASDLGAQVAAGRHYP